MSNPRRQDREVDALYATLPQLACQGYCHDSCGPIDMSIRERSRIVERARKPITCGRGASCSMLTDDRRCGVYDIRPMICRLWGLTRSLRCPYGCEPERWLTDGEAMKLIVEAERIGGSPLGDRLVRNADQIIAALSERELTALAVRFIGAGRASLGGRDVALHAAGARAPFEIPGESAGPGKMAYRKQKP